MGVSADLVGGETTFFKNRNSLEVMAKVTPELGSAIVFPHGSVPGGYPNPFHEGSRLAQGEKVLLRLDVHYDRERR